MHDLGVEAHGCLRYNGRKFTSQALRIRFAKQILRRLPCSQEFHDLHDRHLLELVGCLGAFGSHPADLHVYREFWMLGLAIFPNEHAVAFLPVRRETVGTDSCQPVSLPYFSVSSDFLLRRLPNRFTFLPLLPFSYFRSPLDPSKNLGLIFLGQAWKTILQKQYVLLPHTHVFEQRLVGQLCYNYGTKKRTKCTFYLTKKMGHQVRRGVECIVICHQPTVIMEERCRARPHDLLQFLVNLLLSRIGKPKYWKFFFLELHHNPLESLA